MCKCGCGTRTPIARKTSKHFGWHKGQSLDYCHGHNRRGGEFTPDHRAKISKAKVGVAKTREHRAKLSAALAKHPALTGPQNYNWKGGAGQERERNHADVQLWARRVKRRDDYTCQRCRKCSRQGMHAHHIRPYADYHDLRLDLGNGLTLCKRCHREAHLELAGLRPHALPPSRPADRTATR